MTFDYRGAIAVLGSLAPQPLPGALDLCEQHAQTVTVPVGWELVRLQTELEDSAAAGALSQDSQSDSQNLTALVDALSEAEKAARQSPKRKRSAQGGGQDRNGGGSNTGMPPNPWISHVSLPPMRPRLTVIEGGAQGEPD